MLTLYVQKNLRDNQGSMGLSNVFGQVVREQVLAKVVKKTCSSVRNALRQDVCALYYSQFPIVH